MSIRDGKDTLHPIGEVVELRSFELESLTESHLRWLCDPRLMRFNNQRFRRHNMHSCRAYLALFSTNDNLFIAIYHEEEFIDMMTAYLSAAHRTADMELLISTRLQGNGLGKDPLATLMDCLLNTGTRKVTDGALSCNAAMARIMQGCSMQADGVRASQELVNGAAHDILHFAKFAQI